MSDDQASASAESLGIQPTPSEQEIVLEAQLLKLNRNRHWQERHFIFYSNQWLTYTHVNDVDSPRQCFRVTRESGCEIGDIYVEQRTKGTTKESIYCININWPDDTSTVEDGSVFPPLPGLPSDSSPLLTSHKRSNRRNNILKSPNRPKAVSRQVSAPAITSTRCNRSLSDSASDGRPFSLDGSERDELSMLSLGTPSNHRGLRNWLHRKRDRRTNSVDFHPTSTIVTSEFSKKENKRRSSSNIPSFVNVKDDDPPTIHERAAEGDPAFSQPERNLRLNQQGFRDSNGSQSSPRRAGQDDNRESEQEKLHAVYLDTQRKEKKAIRKKVFEGTKIAAAAGAVAGVGVLTAGVGLAAGLVALGAAAAVGGTAGVAEAGLKRKFQKIGRLTIATTSYEEAKLWKSTLDACLESETLLHSTWGQMYMADGRKTRSALMPNNIEITKTRSGDEVSQSQGFSRGGKHDFPKGQTRIFLRDRNQLHLAGASWRPLESNWISFLGPAAQSIRIFREERIRVEPTSKRVAQLAVRGSTCTPFKTQVVLRAPALDAFMCLMSYSRLTHRGGGNSFAPNSGQSASFHAIEKIDEHTDVIRLVFRKLYLFPSWTEPRDFVLFRYWRYETDGSYTICYESIEHDACPPRNDFVRGEMHQAYTIAPMKVPDKKRKGSTPVIPGAECLLTAVVQVDPKGWVPTRPLPMLSNQTYADAFGVAALMQILDIRDAIECDRFIEVSPDYVEPIISTEPSKHPVPSEQTCVNDAVNYDRRFSNRERCDSVLSSDSLAGLENHPPSLDHSKWAEPDANSFLIRGPTYKKDGVKINAGASIGRLVAVDLVLVDKPILTGMSVHPNERIQQALARERKLQKTGRRADMPPFVFVVNIVLPGPPFYHAVYYYAVDDMSTIDGTDGTGSSRLCQRFLFGDSDDFRDKTFKLIPQIVEGNFMVRKAVGSTPAIMGTKLQQSYVRSDRFMEVILNCGSSAVATGVIRLSLGYAKTLMVDMGFLLEADEEEYLPERIFGCARMKYIEFGPGMLRKVEEPTS